MVGAIGFEPIQLQSLQQLAGLGWHPKDRNGSQGNNYWTWIGHCQPVRFADLVEFRSGNRILAGPNKLALEKRVIRGEA